MEVYMGDLEATVRFWLAGEMPRDDFADIVTAIGSRLLNGARLGQGELDFAKDMDRAEMLEKVSVQSARDFYLHLFQDKTPSPIATVVVREIGSLVADNQKTTDKRGNLIDIKRGSWDNEVIKIYRGESKLSYKTGSKKRKFLEAFDSYLPRSKPD